MRVEKDDFLILPYRVCGTDVVEQALLYLIETELGLAVFKKKKAVHFGL